MDAERAGDETTGIVQSVLDCEEVGVAPEYRCAFQLLISTLIPLAFRTSYKYFCQLFLLILFYHLNGDSSGRFVQIVQCMKKKNREKYLKGFNSALLMIWPVLRSCNDGQRPIWPFHSTFEDAKFEDSSVIIRKKIDVEIQRSPIHSTSSADDCSSRSKANDPSGFSYDGSLLR